jgi:hypothetical protein
VGARSYEQRRLLPAAAGAAVGAAGLGFAAVGLWARRDVRRALAQERIVSAGDAKPPNELVATAAGARSMAEVVRANTLEATAGRTYAEIAPYVDSEGQPTFEASEAAKDERTGQPIESPEHALWVQSITLQSALVQAYMAFRIAELTVAIGMALAAAGAGLAMTGRGCPER